MPNRTTAAAFTEFDKNLKQNPKERAAAQQLHNDITDLLIAAGVIVTAFLQGSFARKTMLVQLRDIDKVVILAEAMRDLTPDEVMDRIEASIAAAYPDATFDRSRHALKVDFGDESFYFDIVPAWETSTDDDDVLIANRDTGTWDRSNTRELMRMVSTRNQDTKGLFIHQVRMGKQTIKHLLEAIVPGLHVESWAYEVIEEVFDHDEAAVRILEAGTDLLGGTYYDPTGVDEISDRLGPEVIDVAQPVLAQAATDARRARQLTDDGDHEGAIAIWRTLFGDCFPAPDDDLAALRTSFRPGATITTTGNVISTSTANRGRRIQPVRPWRTT